MRLPRNEEDRAAMRDLLIEMDAFLKMEREITKDDPARYSIALGLVKKTLKTTA